MPWEQLDKYPPPKEEREDPKKSLVWIAVLLLLTIAFVALGIVLDYFRL